VLHVREKIWDVGERGFKQLVYIFLLEKN